MGIEDVAYHRERLDWTQTNNRILHLCPNVNHVNIRGFQFSEQDTLTGALKEKSLVSFRITTRLLSSLKMLEECPLKLSELMQRWPSLRSIHIERFKFIAELNEPHILKISELPFRCPELQEIIILGRFDCGNIEFLRYLRAVGGSVRRLSLIRRIDIENEAALETLSGCLRTWSRWLEHLRLYISSTAWSYTPLWETLSSLTRLCELQFSGQPLDFNSIATLPQLERLKFDSGTHILGEEAGISLRHLEDAEKLPALRIVVTYPWHWQRYHYIQKERTLLNRDIELTVNA